jgi:hypothetical protein
MIVAPSLTLLWDSRRGKSGGILPWALLIVASGASLAASVAVSHPSDDHRPRDRSVASFALIGSYEQTAHAANPAVDRGTASHAR